MTTKLLRLKLVEMNQKQEKILTILNELFENADEDCPSEYRTKHFKSAMSDADNILIKHNIRKRKEEI